MSNPINTASIPSTSLAQHVQAVQAQQHVGLVHPNSSHVEQQSNSVDVNAVAPINSHPSVLQMNSGQVQQQLRMRKEIYRYTAEETLFVSGWSNKLYSDKRFRLVVGTLLDGENLRCNKASTF